MYNILNAVSILDLLNSDAGKRRKVEILAVFPVYNPRKYNAINKLRKDDRLVNILDTICPLISTFRIEVLQQDTLDRYGCHVYVTSRRSSDRIAPRFIPTLSPDNTNTTHMKPPSIVHPSSYMRNARPSSILVMRIT
ncbi:predicted protein [Sclerotinia sclerotiorum 1980 UF-70]|uniref:Uncharacterized protein n=1 Tax=Sclerotinia sclerotiorum (strain ATCC 18683 / 1980 / Ss-1) TaxID=665079 RepID=A7F2P6_SCLS1|nr:predicted protein [Sclerotinia sclerotiorum 1980 UF-70]EDN95988.1 predicted protein [Sclerotinia sclerotiorum 1980 UF-70]